ncbi:MAG: penicillin-binding transpeptidase domain-containing protein [Patescibacteria group bacterium]
MMLLKRNHSYQVTPDRDDWVAPEEALVDAGSNLSAIEVPVGDGVFRTSYIALALLVCVLVGGVFRLTVLRHDYFGQLSLRNETINVSVPPPRGVIMDRNGTPLVQNVPSFDLLVIARQVGRDENGALLGIAALARIIERNPEELALELEDGIRKNAVFFAATDLTRAQVLAFKDIVPPGFSISTSTKRLYADAMQFAPIIGYVGKVSKADIARDPYYLPSDTIGRLGVEAQYEAVLRGDHGQLRFSNSQTTVSRMATAGAHVVLSVDASVQKELYNAIDSILREAGLNEASAVVQDPRDGSVLGMVSFPSYDNNIFNGSRLSQADYDTLFNVKARPLFNRSISGRYNPGSTIKPFIGMTALQEHIIRPEQVVTNDCISISVPNPSDPENPYVFKNWRPDTGPFNLYRAIADSCNVYFFTVGGGYGTIPGLGIERIDKYLQSAYADALLGIDLPGEERGFVPTPDWKYITKKEPWYQGDTYNTSIGQGDLLVTPLWINSYISAIANGGTLWKPRVAGRIVDEKRETVGVIEARQLGSLPFSSDVIRQMQVAMYRTVTDGTGKLFKDLPVTAAAKTGTAEVIKGQRINSLVTVYAPVENPQVALTVLIEGSAANQGYALRAARRFLGWYFDPARRAGASVAPTL